MTKFALYFSLGKEHILNASSYDHILFIVVLCTMYRVTDWKKVLVLVISFTLGHSVTLALVVFGVFGINSALIEFLIPFTIFITATGNIWNCNRKVTNKTVKINYIFALFFGLIHGMGFSNYLSSLLGKSSSIILELFAFNLGLELGQVMIVMAFMGIGYLVHRFMNVSGRDWMLIISSAVAGVALTLMIDTKFW